jgi:hypothetical protein
VKKIIFLLVIIVLCKIANAQLPKLNVNHSKARNFLNWTNQYNGLIKITVQRSADSTSGYVTIGNIDKPKKGEGIYVDEKPMMGRNFYQLIIKFSEDVEWFSDRRGVYIDSIIMANPKETIVTKIENKKTEPIITSTKIEPPVEVKPPPPPPPVEFTFTPSNHVYTNTYSGHININLENTIGKRYAIIFYDTKKKEALRIDRIGHDNTVVDRHNFNGHGVYSFILREGETEVEKGFVKVN